MKLINISTALGDHRLQTPALQALYPGWNVAAVAERTGIQEVYHLDKYSPVDLILDCFRSVPREMTGQVDTFLFVSQSNLSRFPLISAEVCHLLGASPSVRIVDLNHGCSGFAVALELCNAMFLARISKRAAIVTWDAYSRFMVPPERSTSLLFSDGATVSVLSSEPELEILESYSSFFFEVESSLKVTEADEVCPRGTLSMNGPAVFNFAKSHVTKGVKSVLERRGLRVEDVDVFFFHQASKLVLDAICKSLDIPQHKAPSYFPHYGNVTSSTIPFLINHHSDLLRNHNVFVLCGFGVGLQCVTLLIRRVT
jgi:3-oxoacyl-[acyl-carrier-protein] synthase III